MRLGLAQCGEPALCVNHPFSPLRGQLPRKRDLCESGLVDDLVARTGFLHAGLGPVGGVYLCRIALDRWVLGLLWGQSYSAP